MPRAATTSDVFNAIAEPRRRAILAYLARAERSVSEVAGALRMAQPSTSRHLAVLRTVNVVTARRVGRNTLYRTNGKALKPVHDWVATFERYWTNQLEDIKQIAEEGLAQEPTAAEPIPNPPQES